MRLNRFTYSSIWHIVICITVISMVSCKQKSSLYNKDILLKNSIDTYISHKEELKEKEAHILEIEFYKKPYGSYDFVRKYNGKELIHLCNEIISTEEKRSTLLSNKYDMFEWNLGDYTVLQPEYRLIEMTSWLNYVADHYNEEVAWEYYISGTFCNKKGFYNRKARLIIICFKGMLVINE